MKTAKLGILFLIPLLVIGTSALANEKPDVDHGPTVVLDIAEVAGRAEGDDCSNPIVIPGLPYQDLGQTTCGRGNNYADTCLGSGDGGEDILYQLTLTSTTTVEITMDPLGTTWTGIAIDDECPPGLSCIAFQTGSSSAPRFLSVTLAPGTYYIMVDTWPSPTCIPAFNLSIVEGVPFPNPTCETAIDLCAQGLTTFPTQTCGGGSNYSPTNGCTGYSQAAGEDAVYKIYLTTGQVFAATLTDESYDAAIYLLTDCSNMNSCVAGGDDPETFSYVATADGWYYLVVDGYATGGCGTGIMTIDMPPTPAETPTWGRVKGMFR